MSDFIIGTSNYNTIDAICKLALKESEMIGIIGFPGAGKTTGLETFTENNSNVYYVKATKSMNAKQFYNCILNEMGIEGNNLGKSLYDLINNIAYRLNYNKLRKLIIIDEAGKFKPAFLEYLHELRDKTTDTTGIVIAGPQYFRDNLVKWKDRGVVGIPEFYRRVNYWEQLSPPTIEETRAFCHQFKIKDPKVIASIHERCQNFSEIIQAIKIHLKKLEKLN